MRSGIPLLADMIKFTFINSKSALVNAERGLKPVGLRLDAPAAAVDPRKPGAKAGRQSMYLDELAFKLLTSHKIVGMNAATIDQQLQLLLEVRPPLPRSVPPSCFMADGGWSGCSTRRCGVRSATWPVASCSQ